MKTIDIATGTTSLGDLVDLARKESGIILTREGTPVAEVHPVLEKPARRIAPLHPGTWEISADFDDSLSEEFWLGRG